MLIDSIQTTIQLCLILHISAALLAFPFFMEYFRRHLLTVKHKLTVGTSISGASALLAVSLFPITGYLFTLSLGVQRSLSLKLAHSMTVAATCIVIMIHTWNCFAAKRVRRVVTLLAVGSLTSTVIRTAITSLQQASDVAPLVEESRSSEVINSSQIGSFFPSPMRSLYPQEAASPLLVLSSSERIQIRNEVGLRGYVTANKIGASACVRCHADVVEQWSHSAHRFSSLNNPLYRKPFLDLRSRRFDSGLNSNARSQWCSGCHEPILLLTGTVNDDICVDAPEAQCGLTCVSCHSIEHLHGAYGNGDFSIRARERSEYLFAGSASGVSKALGDLLLRTDPVNHKQAMLNSKFRDSRFCAACHKVSLDVPINDYHWLRGQDDFDSWQLGVYSGEAVPKSPRRLVNVGREAASRTCQDCHMPLEAVCLGDAASKSGRVRSHRFLGSNTVLAAIREDRDAIRLTEQFLQSETASVDIFALRRLDATGIETQLVTALDHTAPELVAGERVEVDIVVDNNGVGHAFPGGTNDTNECWLDFVVSDDHGRVLLESGWQDDARRVDPDAHRFGAIVIDHAGDVTFQRNPTDFHFQLLTSAIPPGEADIVRYRFAVPRQVAGRTVRLCAKLLWRKSRREFIEYALGTDSSSEMPTTLIASAAVALNVGTMSSGSSPFVRSAYSNVGEWLRANDFGAGLLRQGDTRLAKLAFGEVQRVAPGQIEGWRNMALAFIEDMSDSSVRLDDAQVLLSKCDLISPGDLTTAWIRGKLFAELLKYSEAEDAFRAITVRYPRDRQVWKALGSVLFKDLRIDESLDAYERALEIDPEDAEAHEGKWFVLRALGRLAEAEGERRQFERFGSDSSVRPMRAAFLRTHPEYSREADSMHWHEVRAVSTPVAIDPASK